MKKNSLPPPFDILPKPALREIALESKAHLFRQNDKCRGMYFLHVGKVELQRHTAEGATVIIHRASGNETFAEASIFSTHYHCDAVATEACKATLIDQSAIQRAFETDIEFARTLTKLFASNIQASRSHVEMLSINSAQDRVFAALKIHGIPTEIKSFAARIGLTHETTYRAFAALVKNRQITRLARGKYAWPAQR